MRRVVITLLSPADAGGSDPFREPHKIITRLLRRVDGISRWNGVALENDAGRDLAAYIKTLAFDVSGLRSGQYHSPNAKRQKRPKTTITGTLTVTGEIGPIWPILSVGEHCHHGRGAVEGLGMLKADFYA